MHASPTDKPPRSASAKSQHTRDRKGALLWKLLIILLVLDVVITIGSHGSRHRGVMIPAFLLGVGSSHPRAYHHQIFDTPDGIKVAVRHTQFWEHPGVSNGTPPFPGWKYIGSGNAYARTSNYGILSPILTRKEMHFNADPNDDRPSWTTAEEIAIRDAFLQALSNDNYGQAFIAELRALFNAPGGVWAINSLWLINDLAVFIMLLALFYLTPKLLRVTFPADKPPTLCPTCNYDLSATPHRCPECGHVPTPPHAT